MDATSFLVIKQPIFVGVNYKNNKNKKTNIDINLNPEHVNNCTIMLYKTILCLPTLSRFSIEFINVHFVFSFLTFELVIVSHLFDVFMILFYLSNRE